MKMRKSVVTMHSSSSEEDVVGDNDDEHNNCVNNSMDKKRKKMSSCGENSSSRIRGSNMCHQCKRSDKGRVVCCTKCKAKRFCIPCINRWYPGMPEEAFIKACPVCRNLCNCIDCLRLDGLAKHLMNVEIKFSDEEKLEYSKHIVRALLPALEQFNAEQMIEKQIQDKIPALQDSDVNVHKAEYEKDECIYCNYCSAFFVDFHRRCSICTYKLCLTCCKELRNGNLLADASEVRMHCIDHGPGYLHGKGCSIASSKNGTFTETAEVKIRDHTKVTMTSKWKSKENGTISCPPKDMGGCGKGTLNLRYLFSDNWISQLLLKAKEIAQKFKLKEIHNDSELHYSCSKSKGENGTSGGKLRKAAARENSDDNYVFCPAAVDTRRANLRHFRLYLAKGEPLVVTNVHDNALGLSWEPMVMWRACRQTKKATDVLNCFNWCKLEMNIHQFFKGFMLGRFDSFGWPQLFQLNDWPPSGLFDERLPRHGAEFSSCLPFMEYTHPQYGYLNLALGLPDNCSKPNLGPKAYIAYGFPKELERGDSVTKLHYAVIDTVNVLMHTQPVVPTVEQLSAIENLKQIHKAQDQREFVGNAFRILDDFMDCIHNVNGKSDGKGMNFAQEKQNYDGLKVENSSKSENKKYSQQSVKADCQKNKEGEDSSSLVVLDRSEGFEEADGGALWDVFRRQDVPKLEEYLRKHFREFRHIYGSPLPQVVHPILDETFYLSTEHKRRLKEEYGIEPWTFVQKLGEAVFVPAGCPYQVRNLKSCINVAVDFISPENVNESIRLTEELRKLPRNHDAKKDKFGVMKIIVHAMSQAVDQLEKTLLNSEAGIGTGLALSSSISKSINSMPGTPKSSSSISEDLSSNMTGEREEFVAPSEDEKPRIAEVNLRSPLPVLDHLSSANKAIQGPIVPKPSTVLEDLHSSKTVKGEEYLAPSEDVNPRTAEVNRHSPLPVLSANKAQESTSVPSQELKQSINIEDVESTFHTIQSFLKSLPEKYSRSQTCLQSNSTSSTQTLAKLIFDCSIRLPLEALVHDSMNEKEMCSAIAALNENPSSLFSDEQAKQLVKLKYEFPVMVNKWRYLAQAESRYQEFLTCFEEDREKLNSWSRLEEALKSEYVKREKQAREFEELLQTIRTRQKEIMEDRHEASQEAQKLMLLVQEKVGNIGSTSTELESTKMQMEVLRRNWSNFQSKFP
ncbi:unnamed protein product [Withania somnifera]